MPNEQNNQFPLSDFYLAVFLRVKGLNIINIDKTNPRRALFVFEDSKDRKKLVGDFLFGRAQVEPKRFAAVIKELKQLLHSSL